MEFKHWPKSCFVLVVFVIALAALAQVPPHSHDDMYFRQTTVLQVVLALLIGNLALVVGALVYWIRRDSLLTHIAAERAKDSAEIHSVVVEQAKISTAVEVLKSDQTKISTAVEVLKDDLDKLARFVHPQLKSLAKSVRGIEKSVRGE